MPVEPNPTPPPAPVTPGAPPNPSGSDPAAHVDPSIQPQSAKPEGLPDQFWDPKAGFKQKEFIESYNGLATEYAARAKTFENFPADPKDAGKFYTLPEQLLPEGMELPKGLTFEPDQDLLAAALPIAHKHKLAPEAFQDLVRSYNAIELKRFQDAQNHFAEDAKKLGEKAPARRKAIADGLKALVGEEKAKFVDAEAITSGAVEFFEEILKKFSGQSNVVPLTPKRETVDPAAEQPKSLAERMWPNQGKAS
jgi:hypothetical protein